MSVGNYHYKYAYGCNLLDFTKGMRRDRNASMTWHNSSVTFHFEFSTSRVAVQCKWQQRIIFFVFTGFVKASTNKISVAVTINLTNEFITYPTLEDFEVTYMDEIETAFNGLGLFNFLVRKILDWRANLAKEALRESLTVGVANALRNELKRIWVPYPG
ncbi:hypothetical protein SK128_003422, partial [Halocaridina rubra]